jgi:Ecdysteroid kinase-like family
VTLESLPKAAQAELLTDALRRSGVLGDARVCDVAVASSRPTLLSQITRLRLTYDSAAPDAPATVILKTGLPERAGDRWNAGRQEVAFYAQVASAMPARLVPRCFEAHWDADTNAWRLLLEDLTDTHVIATTWPLPPTMEQCESILRARARFHAAWWDDPRLGTEVGTWLDSEAMARQLQTFAEKFASFVDRVGDRLPRERRDLYERLLAAAPRLNARYHSHRNLTIIHGDAHVWNSFLPRDGEGGDVRLFDWDTWRIDTGTDDLAYMMAMHWYPDHRRRAERALLDRYHATLVEHGVRGYDRGAIDDDYRLSALWLITTPVFQASVSIPPVIWWNNLERIWLAVDDLGCRDLLG